MIFHLYKDLRNLAVHHGLENCLECLHVVFPCFPQFGPMLDYPEFSRHHRPFESVAGPDLVRCHFSPGTRIPKLFARMDQPGTHVRRCFSKNNVARIYLYNSIYIYIYLHNYIYTCFCTRKQPTYTYIYIWYIVALYTVVYIHINMSHPWKLICWKWFVNNLPT